MTTYPASPLRRSRFDAAARRGGFTLIEMLVSIVILVVLMAIIFQIIQLTSSAYKQTTQSTGTMQGARVAFERMTRNISQATLNTYYSYLYSGTTISNYFRQSELHFVSGWGPVAGGGTFVTNGGQGATQISHAIFFQAPLGVVSQSNSAAYGNLGNLLNACGYFVMYGPDTSRPGFLNTAGFSNAPANENRFRLMEYLQPSEYLSVYTTGAVSITGTTTPTWVSNGLPTNLTMTSPNVRTLASNIVALIIMPEQYASSAGTVNGQANTIPVFTPTVANPTTTSFTPTLSTCPYGYDSAYYPTGKQKILNLTTFVSSQFTTNNQLPPLVKVIMVAIDEASAARLSAAPAYSAKTSTNPPDLGNLVTSSAALFQKSEQLFTNNGVEGDLEKFEDILNATAGNLTGNTTKLNFFVFQSDVIIRGAKWTVN